MAFFLLAILPAIAAVANNEVQDLNEARPSTQLGEALANFAKARTLGEGISTEMVQAKWEGSFNSTQGAAKPHSDGKPMNSTALQGCATQTTVGRKRKSYGTCTSCKPGFLFITRFAKAQAGECRRPVLTPSTRCTELDRNVKKADLRAKNMLCTKIAKARSHFALRFVKDAATKKFFAPVAKRRVRGKKNAAWVYCILWKQTVCRNTECRVKKEVKCDKVCEVKGWDGSEKQANGRCFKSLCKGKYGTVVCRETAMLA